MTGSFETHMTCAHNISAVHHEKRACRVKCTLCTQSQEATKTHGTTLTESRGKNDLRTACIYPVSNSKKNNTSGEQRTTVQEQRHKNKTFTFVGRCREHKQISRTETLIASFQRERFLIPGYVKVHTISGYLKADIRSNIQFVSSRI